MLETSCGVLQSPTDGDGGNVGRSSVDLQCVGGAAYMNGEDTGNGGSFARSIAALIDRACDRFEAVWKSGQQPRIEEYLSELAGKGPHMFVSY